MERTNFKQTLTRLNGLGSCYSIILFYPITLEGRWGTTDEFATIPFHLDPFSAALVELAKSILVHSLILSSHLFFCLLLFLFPFTVPCRIVFAKPEDLETWPNHLSFCFLTRVILERGKPFLQLNIQFINACKFTCDCFIYTIHIHVPYLSSYKTRVLSL